MRFFEKIANMFETIGDFGGELREFADDLICDAEWAPMSYVIWASSLVCIMISALVGSFALSMGWTVVVDIVGALTLAAGLTFAVSSLGIVGMILLLVFAGLCWSVGSVISVVAVVFYALSVVLYGICAFCRLVCDLVVSVVA